MCRLWKGFQIQTSPQGRSTFRHLLYNVVVETLSTFFWVASICRPPTFVINKKVGVDDYKIAVENQSKPQLYKQESYH